ncbi:MAG: ABC transporter ATP-binding protein [Burkholderiaceae bacterium]|nr:ABC transporter ATP-binding protein [Microbacteriaceae bacterium]
MSAHLHLNCVSKSFSTAHAPALDDVTLEVPAGSCTAILGPSGSGKSTILRVMAGLDFVSAGQVLVDGTDIAGLAPERRGMGMVFQRPLLFPHLSVLDNVAFADRVGGASRTQSRRNAAAYLDMVQLGDYGGRSVQELSGGQEQRVAIARALAAKPSVLLLDEPFSALDPALRADMHELIRDIRSALSPTIVLVTHDRDEAAAVADRIAVLHLGELLQHDTVDRVYNRPASLRVARLMGGLNEVPGRIADGAHHSSIGRVEFDVTSASADGRSDAAATLVVRQEAVGVRLLGGDPGIDADEFAGTVTGVRNLGPRRMLTVTFSAGDEPAVELRAELPPGQGVEIGSRVAVRLPRAAVSTVTMAGHRA